MERTRNSRTRLEKCFGGRRLHQGVIEKSVTYQLLHSVVVLDGTHHDARCRLQLGVLCADEVEHAAEATPTYLLASLEGVRLVLARWVNMGMTEE
jgi:hypothetical protein